MTETDEDDLVRAWIALQHAEENSTEFDSNLWAHDKFWDINEEDPTLCWKLVLRILATEQSSPIMETLSAGPLEDLLAKHGPLVIDWVENEARVNPAFAFLLGGVWKSTMNDDVWGRVQIVWNRKGWDGN